MRRFFAAALVVLCPALARGEAGVTGAATLARPFGARAMGMAQAFAAVPGGLESVDYNPAGLAAAKKPALATSYTHGAFQDNFGYLGYAQPLRFAVLDAGLLYYDAGSIHLALSDGTNSTVDAEQDYVALLGAAIPLPFGFSVGGIAKAYRFNLAQQATATGFAADVGAQWMTPLPGFSLGAALQNAGPNVKFEQQGDPLPLVGRVGAAYAVDLEKLGLLHDASYALSQFLFTADAVQPRGGPINAAVGLEMAMPFTNGRAALRGGYVFNNSGAQAAFGVGLQEGRFFFDYALGVERTIGNTENFALGLEF